MSNVDDILFAPVEKAILPVEWYMKGEKVPDHLLKFDDQRVVVRFGVDAEVVLNPMTQILWVYPLQELNTDECVIEIIYPEKKIFKNKNHVIISFNPQSNDPAHKQALNTEAVREIWP